MNIFLTPSQKTAFSRIAALPDCNSRGGPGMQGLAAVRALPESDRAPVLQAFADEVHARMSVDERLAVVRGVMRHINASSQLPAGRVWANLLTCTV